VTPRSSAKPIDIAIQLRTFGPSIGEIVSLFQSQHQGPQSQDIELVSTVAMVALFGGLRLGEVLALRWTNVDLDRKVLRVVETLEQTKAFGIRFKAPKSKAGKRNVTMPDILVEALQKHRKAQLELRVQLGLGKLPDDALLFSTIEGHPLSTIDVSCEWGRVAGRIGIPEITFHALRHTHASQLIDAGVDIATISKRLGHATPAITLSVYAHRFRQDDGKAPAINAAVKW
jgi:integrase